MMITKIIIAIDGSAVAEHAAHYGFEIARKFNAAVGVANIVEPALLPQMSTSTDPIMGLPTGVTGIEEVELMDIQQQQSANIVDDAIQKLAGDLEVTHFNEFGSTADGIIQCSKTFNADLIVIGTHSRSGLDRLLMGSIAEHVIRHAEVPVLVVPMNKVHSS